MRKFQIDQFVSHSRSRRRGQALLLSVVIMIFIVLLGTTFIAIVASNMSNTARTGSKDEARQAALAGIEFADTQLTGSNDGLDWRPDVTNPPPASGGSGYNFYYTSLDRAQGWNDNTIYKRYSDSASPYSQFVKYPNPLGTSSPGNTANFMIRVSQVLGTDPDNSNNTKTGDIRIESIGFANDDSAAYNSIVAYKKGGANNPLVGAMRSVSNWDFTDNTVPQGYANSAAIGASSLTLSNQSGIFDPNDCPFYITIGDPAVGSVASAMVTGVTGTTLTLSTGLSVPVAAGALVQKAAGLGAPATVNFDNANTTSVDYRISGINNPYGTLNNTPGSVWVNGGLVWFGTNPTTAGIANFDGIKATNLIAPSAATSLSPASTIQLSGLFTSAITPSSTLPTTVNVSGCTTPVGCGAVSGTLPSDSAVTPSNNPLITSGLVNDGWNRLQGSLDLTRQVQNFTPPDITSGVDGFGRYRQLTQYSASTDSNNPQGSAYGYGQGIYINNPTDVEKAGTTPMTQKQLGDLWYGTGSTNYNRLGIPDAANISTSSLEQQHMRGWV
ncbi:MAG: hypothetical protein ABI210_11835, partial [Abditibacteriaceae bacterium]